MSSGREIQSALQIQGQNSASHRSKRQRAIISPNRNSRQIWLGRTFIETDVNRHADMPQDYICMYVCLSAGNARAMELSIQGSPPWSLYLTALLPIPGADPGPEAYQDNGERFWTSAAAVGGGQPLTCTPAACLSTCLPGNMRTMFSHRPWLRGRFFVVSSPSV